MAPDLGMLKNVARLGVLAWLPRGSYPDQHRCERTLETLATWLYCNYYHTTRFWIYSYHYEAFKSSPKRSLRQSELRNLKVSWSQAGKARPKHPRPHSPSNRNTPPTPDWPKMQPFAMETYLQNPLRAVAVSLDQWPDSHLQAPRA